VSKQRVKRFASGGRSSPLIVAESSASQTIPEHLLWVTLESLGVMLDPLKRQLRPLPMLLV